MQPVPASYSTANATAQRTPIYAVEILDYASPPVTHRFSTHPIPATTTSDYMQLPHGFEAQVIPELGQSSIGNITFVLEDINEDVTQLVMEGIDGATATVKAGFADITYANFITVFVGIVDSIRLTGDLTGYEITLRDAQTLTNRQVFDVAVSQLSGAIDADDTTLPIMDASAFQSSGLIRIDNEYISYGAYTAEGAAPQDAERIGVGFGGGEFLAVMENLLASQFRTSKSSDGQIWRDLVDAPVGSEGGWRNPIFLPTYGTLGRWVVCNAGSTSNFHIAYSDDLGRNWTGVNIDAGVVLVADLAYSPSLDRLLAVGVKGGTYIASSDDGGVTWTQRVNDVLSAGWMAVTWDPTLALFIFVSTANYLVPTEEIGTSPDGTTTFNYYFAPVLNAWNDVATDGAGHIVIVGDNTGVDRVITSSNGTTFASHAGAISSWASVVKANSWVAVARVVGSSATHQAAVSDDNGATWTVKPTPVDANWRGVAYDPTGHVLVATAAESTPAGSGIMFSLDDGETWSIAGSFATGATRGLFQTAAISHNAGAVITEIFHLGPQHPIDIVLGTLQNTDKTGVAMDSTLIDIAGLITLKNAIGSSYAMEFFIDTAENLKTWLEDEIYKPLQLYQVPHGGLYSIHQSIVPTVPVATLTHDEIISSGSSVALAWDGNFRASLINSVQYQYDYDSITRGYTSTVVFEDAASIARYGKTSLLITSKGLQTILFGTDDLIDTVGNSIIARLRNGTPKIQIQVFLSQHWLEPGDIVALTSTLLPNPVTMARGVSGALWEVLSRGMVFDQGHVQLTLIWPAWRDVPTAADIAILAQVNRVRTEDAPRSRRQTIRDTHLRSGSS